MFLIRSDLGTTQHRPTRNEMDPDKPVMGSNPAIQRSCLLSPSFPLHDVIKQKDTKIWLLNFMSHTRYSHNDNSFAGSKNVAPGLWLLHAGMTGISEAVIPPTFPPLERTNTTKSLRMANVDLGFR